MVQPDSENKVENKENIEELKKALEEEKTRSEANLVGWQRAQADFVNYKRFAEQERAEISKNANIGLLNNILPILDDFERALASVPTKEKHNQLVEGLKLIDRKFRDTLEKQGITAIKTIGEEFDCRLMEAVTCAKGKKDIVIQELEKGYKLQDKVIRPAKVVVGIGEEEANKED